MKKLLFVICILLVSGCTPSYDLEISNNSFKENISVNINKSEIPAKRDDNIEVDDQITPFLTNDYEAINSKAKYKKIVTDNGDYYQVLMSYKYSEKEFNEANSLKKCFRKYEFNNNKKYYIHAYGQFYCLYSDEMKINIKTNNKVLRNNADIVTGNVYTWIINNENVNNVDIEFEVEKGFSYAILIYIGIGVVCFIALIKVYMLVSEKRKEINEF